MSDLKSLKIWVDRVRNLGKIVFLSGKNSLSFLSFEQIVIKDKELIKISLTIGIGDLIEVIGIEQEKENNVKDNLKNNEILAVNITIIKKSKTLPFLLNEEKNISDENRFRFRFLDLRKIENSYFLYIKSRFLYETRCFFNERFFLEIDTPILSPLSPEGAKCFKVISNFKDSFYSLSQSPQIFKQMLMVSGFSRYYQIAKCFRNEDPRSNRQIEFLQLDVEKSFTTEKELIDIIESFINTVIGKVFKKRFNITFSYLTFKESIKKYNTDKPDIRVDKTSSDDLSFVWVINWPLFQYDKENKKYKSLRHPFTKMIDEQKDLFLKKNIRNEDIIANAFDLVCNGEEIVSGGLRINDRDLQEYVFSILGYSNYDIKKYFDYFLEALEFAAPPHGGFGLGIDRLLSVILGVKNLREFTAFPKSSDGKCLLTRSPSEF